MDWTDYQGFVNDTAMDFKCSPSYVYPALGLAGETGELVELVKKLVEGEHIPSQRLTSELGDVLWYLTRLCDLFGVTLKGVADYNQEKLTHRREHGKECQCPSSRS